MSAELFLAIADHDLKRIRTLLSQGADANATQPEWPKFTALQAAINELEEGGPLEALRLLLDKDAAIDGWDVNHDATPLLMAVFRGQLAAVRLLLEAGADPNVRGGEGDTALRWCVDHHEIEMATLLLSKGAIKTIDEAGGLLGYTALGLAARALNVPMIRLLLDAGADPKATDEDGRIARDRMPELSPANRQLRATVEKWL